MEDERAKRRGFEEKKKNVRENSKKKKNAFVSIYIVSIGICPTEVVLVQKLTTTLIPFRHDTFSTNEKQREKEKGNRQTKSSGIIEKKKRKEGMYTLVYV